MGCRPVPGVTGEYHSDTPFSINKGIHRSVAMGADVCRQRSEGAISIEERFRRAYAQNGELKMAVGLSSSGSENRYVASSWACC